MERWTLMALTIFCVRNRALLLAASLRSAGRMLLASALLTCAPLSLLSAAEVEDVRLWSAPDYTRVVLDMDELSQYSVFALEDPARIVIDIRNTRVSASLSALDFKDSPVTGIRSAVRNETDVRLVLDLARTVNPSSFTLEANAENKNRLVVDLYEAGQAPAVAQTVEAPQAPVSAQRDIIVAIDAGTWGRRPGSAGL
jgi:N-acetylmuramoyl-L-alanine amidase